MALSGREPLGVGRCPRLPGGGDHGGPVLLQDRCEIGGNPPSLRRHGPCSGAPHGRHPPGAEGATERAASRGARPRALERRAPAPRARSRGGARLSRGHAHRSQVRGRRHARSGRLVSGLSGTRAHHRAARRHEDPDARGLRGSGSAFPLSPRVPPARGARSSLGGPRLRGGPLARWHARLRARAPRRAHAEGDPRAGWAPPAGAGDRHRGAAALRAGCDPRAPDRPPRRQAGQRDAGAGTQGPAGQADRLRGRQVRRQERPREHHPPCRHRGHARLPRAGADHRGHAHRSRDGSVRAGCGALRDARGRKALRDEQRLLGPRSLSGVGTASARAGRAGVPGAQ